MGGKIELWIKLNAFGVGYQTTLQLKNSLQFFFGGGYCDIHNFHRYYKFLQIYGYYPVNLYRFWSVSITNFSSSIHKVLCLGAPVTA